MDHQPDGAWLGLPGSAMVKVELLDGPLLPAVAFRAGLT